MTSSIGIKIANGEFYPILSASKPSKKRMLLTTVHDWQRSVQIDIYQSQTKTMSDAKYIGSLVVEKLKAKKKGEPSVELVVSQDSEGEIAAWAKDLDNPKTNNDRLTVSLNAAGGESSVELEDFSIDGFDVSSETEAKLLIEGGISEHEEKKKSKALPIIIAAVLLLAAGAFCAWFFLLNGKALLFPSEAAVSAEVPEAASIEPVAPPPPAAPPPIPQEESALSAESAVQNSEPPEGSAAASPTPPVVEAPPVERPAAVVNKSPPPPVIETLPTLGSVPVQVERIRAPVRSYTPPNPIPIEGAVYMIRWGDTLWDISDVFYRNPWRYRFLARYNGISNPNLIISGKTVRIPPTD